jgi:methyltransferase (TIGR00027 family)
MHAVSYTAQWMAAVRALETERDGDRLFEDPLARDLAAPRGFELVDRYVGGGLVPFIIIRTRFFDDSIALALADGEIRQVVLIAAGMDTRAFRLPWPADAVVYEVDHGPLLEEKRRRLSALNAEPPVKRVEVAADLTQDWLPQLEKAGFDPTRPTLWLAEGLTFFLTDEQAAGLLRTFGSVSAPGSRLSLDILGRALLRNPFAKPVLDTLKADGTPWIFGTDEPEEFLARNGWTITDLKEPGQPGAGEGRWPYELQPPGRRGAQRQWLIRARLSDV